MEKIKVVLSPLNAGFSHLFKIQPSGKQKVFYDNQAGNEGHDAYHDMPHDGIGPQDGWDLCLPRYDLKSS